MFLKIRFNAYALLSAVIIATIISIVIGALLLLQYSSNTEWARYKRNEKLRNNLSSSINIVLYDSTNFNTIGEKQIDLFGTQEDSVKITKYYWGSLNAAQIKSFYQAKSCQKNFFYGSILEDTLSSCLYLVNHQRPLQISGTTQLIGNVYSSGGVKSATIDGKDYKNNKLVYGDILRSDTVYPFVNQSLINEMYISLNKCLHTEISKDYLIEKTDSIYNSFDNNTSYYFISKDKKMPSYISGKIILFSDSTLFIKRNTKIENAILIAPEIEVEDGFSGSVQLIANKVITIGAKCDLKYPSAIILLKDSINTYQGEIHIGKGTSLSGVIFANSLRNDRYKSIVEIQSGALITGVIYVHGFLKISGSVFGTVITDYFLYKSVINTYENSLVDATLDRSKLSTYFIAPSLVKRPGKLKIIKWLN